MYKATSYYFPGKEIIGTWKELSKLDKRIWIIKKESDSRI
jgi:hypothetical protein